MSKQYMVCQWCRGSGKIRTTYHKMSGKPYVKITGCPMCKGAGRVEVNAERMEVDNDN